LKPLSPEKLSSEILSSKHLSSKKVSSETLSSKHVSPENLSSEKLGGFKIEFFFPFNTALPGFFPANGKKADGKKSAVRNAKDELLRGEFDTFCHGSLNCLLMVLNFSESA
jgi:hypothetical protein